MSIINASGLLTPPESPLRKSPPTRQNSSSDGEVRPDLAWERIDQKAQSLSSGLLSPPVTPKRSVCGGQLVLKPRPSRQLDGYDGSVAEGPRNSCRPYPQTLTPVYGGPASIPSGRNPRRADLTLPTRCPFPSPVYNGSATSTPLTRALPAKDAYPFPTIPQHSNTLSPLSLRRSRPTSAPGQGRSPITSARSRRFSGPDRFIHGRNGSTSLHEDYRLSRSPERLTVEERAKRRRPADSDPFRQSLQRPANRPQTQLPTRARATNPSGANTTPIQSQSGFGWDLTRRVSQGSVWSISGVVTAAESVVPVQDGRGRLLGSGTNAPLHTARFLTKTDVLRELDLYERRLALAFDIDQSNRILRSPDSAQAPGATITSSDAGISSPHSFASPCLRQPAGGIDWRDSEWIRSNVLILDAPSLRDDFYCSLLAYSVPAKALAVGLGNHIYLWSEDRGVETPETLNAYPTSHLTSLSFSSTQGRKSILAVGRADGRLVLWSSLDQESRFTSKQQQPISCLTFRPHPVKRPSKRDRHIQVDTEELLVGDELGHVYYYAIEWPDSETKALFDWQGSMNLLARISVHTQQVCGLAWSYDGDLFASGGNDNLCALFESKRIVADQAAEVTVRTETYVNANGEQTWTVSPGDDPALPMSPSRIKHQWVLNAAVKAIAFCPWQRGLIAIGGGSNDRCIHFYHTVSGACLATIDCSAQITSLIWSTTRHELCATFGFAQPEHPYRIAVFAWPSCEQVIAIPWFDEHRALHAIAYPGGPSPGRKRNEGGRWWKGTSEEGSIVVATSDASIKFHEVWSEGRRASVDSPGLLGGSDILESLHGVDQRGNGAIR